MRKIDLTPYETDAGPFDPTELLPAPLTSREAGLSPDELMANKPIADRIRAAEDSILLEEAEWKAVVDTLRRIRSWHDPWYEMLTRIWNAPQVPVQEAKE